MLSYLFGGFCFCCVSSLMFSGQKMELVALKVRHVWMAAAAQSCSHRHFKSDSMLLSSLWFVRVVRRIVMPFPPTVTRVTTDKLTACKVESLSLNVILQRITTWLSSISQLNNSLASLSSSFWFYCLLLYCFLHFNTAIRSAAGRCFQWEAFSKKWATIWRKNKHLAVKEFVEAETDLNWRWILEFWFISWNQTELHMDANAAQVTILTSYDNNVPVLCLHTDPKRPDKIWLMRVKSGNRRLPPRSVSKYYCWRRCCRENLSSE